MDSIVDSLFDRYDRGRITRRHLVQTLAAFALPASTLAQDAAQSPTPIVRGLSVNHVQLAVRDVARSTAFYQRLFGVTKGWPTVNAATGIHLDLPDGYISLSSSADKPGVIGHFAVGVDHIDADAAKRFAEKISSEMPDAQAKASFQENDGVWTVNLNDPDGVRVQISPKDGR
jgi:catechol 2,3-dioxygenase-like lactoylglutathione lyase family enzyme